MTITYLPDTDEWRVEWEGEGKVSIQHDLAEAIGRVMVWLQWQDPSR